MKLKYLYPHWGSESLTCSEFFATAAQFGFDGIEINIPRESELQGAFLKSLEQKRKLSEDFVFIAQQVLGLQKETPDEYVKRALDRLKFVAQFNPDCINSHTGKDHYSFSDIFEG